MCIIPQAKSAKASVVEAGVEIELFAALPAGTDKATCDAINVYLTDVAIQIARTFFVPVAMMKGANDGRD